MYVRVDPLSKLEAIYRGVQYKDVLKKQTKAALVNYNEFDL
jgi:hypothetical protein